MTPYRVEQIGDCTLYLGDCLELLPTLGKFDAVVTDPPYGINYNPSGGDGVTARGVYTRVRGDDQPFDPRPFIGLGPSILWGANHYAERLPSSPGWLTWIKIGDGASCDTSDVELAWTSLKMPARRFNHIWRGMIRASEKEEARVHPTQKPIALMEWCLGFLPDAAVIFDPFMGSGTTGVACVKSGRAFIGCELEEKYFDIACRRIEQAYKQPDMFIEKPKPLKQEAMEL